MDEDITYWRMWGNQGLVEQGREDTAEAVVISGNNAGMVSMHLTNIEGF